VAAYQVRLFGDPGLKQPARAVTEIDGRLAALVDSMYDTMYEAVGIGLAAPQVGVRKRLFTYDVGEGPHVIVNPEIVETSGEWSFEEGCLSVPGLHFEIVRPDVVTLRGLDLDGDEIEIRAGELLGRLFQHEVDHLDGVLLLDRLDSDTRRQALRELRERDLSGAPASTPGGPRQL
jgi:peptide deformylase